MKIQMVMYPGMTLLDLVGPLQVWNMWPDGEIQLVWKTTDPIQTDSAAIITPTQRFAEAWTDPDIIFLPGGTTGTFAVMKDQEVLDFISARGREAQWITSVCTGALVLGAAGLLNGYQCTTHWLALDELSRFGGKPVKKRWVIDRNRATGGGVTAGIDFGLALMTEVAGEDAARFAQLGLEYTPDPPFTSGHPDEALPQTVEAMKAYWSGLLSDMGGSA